MVNQEMECVMFLLLSSLLTFDHRMYRCAEVIDAAATAGDLSSPNLGYIRSFHTAFSRISIALVLPNDVRR